MGLSMHIENENMSMDPRALTKADKERYVGSVFICDCRKDISLRYGIRKGTLALYPKENRFATLHSIFCELNDSFSKNNRINILEKDDDSGELSARLRNEEILSPIKKAVINACFTKRRSRYTELREQTTLPILLREMNLEAAYRQSQWMATGKQKGYKSLPDFNKIVWAIAKDTRLKDRPYDMAGDLLKPYGIKFSYSQITGVSQLVPIDGKLKTIRETAISEGFLEKTLKYRIDNNKVTHLKLHYISNFDGSTRTSVITPKALYYGAKQYLSDYNVQSIDFENDKVCAGFFSYETGSRIDRGSGKSIAEYSIGRLEMFLVNTYGTFAESRKEAAAYDMIMDFCNAHEGLYPYKPYRYTLNAYGGEFLEDMLIQNRNGKDIVIELTGTAKKEDLAERDRLKEKFIAQSTARYEFVRWNVEEGYASLESRLEKAVQMP